MRTAFFIFVLTFPLVGRSQNLLSGPNDIVFDEPRNRYIVSCWAGNRIVAIDLQGAQSMYRDNVTRAHGMQIRDSVLYVASYRSLLVLDLATGNLLKSIPVASAQYLGHLTLDDSRYVYISDWSARRIFRVDIIADTASMFLPLTDMPVGIWFDGQNSRLILLTFIENAPIRAISLPGGTLSTITTTTITNTDAICRDATGNYYVSSLTGNAVYRFNADWSGTPTLVSAGLGGPSGLGYNARDNVLGVTNYDSSTIALIPLGSVEVRSGGTGKPMDFYLHQNYPNPFNPRTMIQYSVPRRVVVKLDVHNLLGNQVALLVDTEQPPGEYRVAFDGSALASGIYFYRLAAGNVVETKKMLYMK